MLSQSILLICSSSNITNMSVYMRCVTSVGMRTGNLTGRFLDYKLRDSVIHFYYHIFYINFTTSKTFVDFATSWCSALSLPPHTEWDNGRCAVCPIKFLSIYCDCGICQLNLQSIEFNNVQPFPSWRLLTLTVAHSTFQSVSCEIGKIGVWNCAPSP